MTQGNPPTPDQGGYSGSDQPAGSPGAQPGEPDWYAPFTPDPAVTPPAEARGAAQPWPGQPGSAPAAPDPNAAGQFAQGPWGGAAGPAAQGPWGGAAGPAGQGPYGGSAGPGAPDQVPQGQYAQGPYGGTPPAAAGPYPQGPYQPGPYQPGPYQPGPYQQGPYAQGPYGGPGPNFPMAPPGWQGGMYMGRRRMSGAYLRRRAITHITMGFILLIVGIAITAGSYAASGGQGYYVTFFLIIIGVFWVIRGFAMLARSSRLP